MYKLTSLYHLLFYKCPILFCMPFSIYFFHCMTAPKLPGCPYTNDCLRWTFPTYLIYYSQLSYAFIKWDHLPYTITQSGILKDVILICTLMSTKSLSFCIQDPHVRGSNLSTFTIYWITSHKRMEGCHKKCRKYHRARYIICYIF